MGTTGHKNGIAGISNNRWVKIPNPNEIGIDLFFVRRYNNIVVRISRKGVWKYPLPPAIPNKIDSGLSTKSGKIDPRINQNRWKFFFARFLSRSRFQL